MTKRDFVLISVALVLAGVYAVYFTNWFAPKIIHITSTNARTSRAASARKSGDDAATIPVLFKLGRPRKLTDLKVVALDEWQTNHDCLPLWHMVPGTNSVAQAGPFYYGDYIPGTRRDYYIQGMKPELPGTHAQPLQPGVKYRLFVADGKAKGELDFQVLAK